MGKVKIWFPDKPCLTLTRDAVVDDKLVYLILANKKLPYHNGASRVAYIGTTKNGVSRCSQSLSLHAYDLLNEIHGVNKAEVFIVTCKPRRKVKTWKKLERALLIKFKELYGEPPYCNNHGKRMIERDEFEYFDESKIRAFLRNIQD